MVQGVIFTRVPSLAAAGLAGVFFAATGLGVVAGRLVVSRRLGASHMALITVSTALTAAGLVALANLSGLLTGALGGALIGLGSGVLMQVLTNRLTELPAFQHGRQLARYSAAVALGMGIGGFAAGLFGSKDPVGAALPALVAITMFSTAVAIFSGRTTRALRAAAT